MKWGQDRQEQNEKGVGEQTKEGEEPAEGTEWDEGTELGKLKRVRGGGDTGKAKRSG